MRLGGRRNGMWGASFTTPDVDLLNSNEASRHLENTFSSALMQTAHQPCQIKTLCRLDLTCKTCKPSLCHALHGPCKPAACLYWGSQENVRPGYKTARPPADVHPSPHSLLAPTLPLCSSDLPHHQLTWLNHQLLFDKVGGLEMTSAHMPPCSARGAV